MRSPKQIKPQSPSFAVEWWPVGRVTPYPNNARVIPASAVEKVASSIRAFGWRQPIVVDADGVIIVGHVRLLAAQSMAMTEVPVHVALDLTPGQVKAYRLMDNRSHDEATWDLDLIGPELQSIQELDSDFDLALTGFDQDELNAYLVPARGNQRGRGSGLVAAGCPGHPARRPVALRRSVPSTPRALRGLD